jgi:hypothetical protein
MFRVNFRLVESVADESGAMSVDTILEMGRNSKSHTSRGNIFNFIVGAAMFAAALTGCNKGDDKNDEVAGNDGIDKLVISVENGKDYSSRIDKVKLIAGDGEGEELAVADYNDGKITLNLPSTVAVGYLYGIGYGFSSTVTVSNPDAQMAEIEIAGYKGDKRVCWFNYEKETENSGLRVSGFPVYVNKALSVTGTETRTENERDITRIYEDNYKYSIDLKRGWNMLYYIRNDKTEETANGVKYVYTRESTTTEQSGQVLECVGCRCNA